MITATQEAIDAIRLFLTRQESPLPLRIHLQSTGCCDASLGLMMDEAGTGDLRQDIQGIAFVIRPEVYQLTGRISIACGTGEHREGFVLTSEHPLNEWSGFGVCRIRCRS